MYSGELELDRYLARALGLEMIEIAERAKDDFKERAPGVYMSRQQGSLRTYFVVAYTV